jgi:hypothetical protein
MTFDILLLIGSLKMNFNLKRATFLITLLTVFVTISFLVYQQIYTNAEEPSRYLSDTTDHIKYMAKFFWEDNFYIAHPLWHATSFFISLIFSISLGNGSVIASALYVSLWFLLTYLFIKMYIKNENLWLFMSISLFLIGPFWLPFYKDGIIYFGVGSPNIWHNVTLWCVKPFALLAVWLTVEGLSRESMKLLFFAISVSIVSIFAKPSFIIAFLPSLLLFAFIQKLHRDKRFLLFYGVLSLISVLILAYQYLHTFTSQDSHITIDFFGVWSISSKNIPLSIVLALFFPMLLTLLSPKLLQDKYMLIGWIMVLVSIFYYSTFAQSGKLYAHGNFGWSYMISLSLIYLFASVKFFEMFKEMESTKRYIILSVFLFQTFIGAYYFFQILMGEHPLFIRL